jgi:hypothetical protein
MNSSTSYEMAPSAWKRDDALRVREVVELRLVELVVLLVGDLGLALLPDGHHGVDGLLFHHVLVLHLVVVAGVLGLRQRTVHRDVHDNGVAHVVAVALDQHLQARLVQEVVVAVLLRVVLHGQDDVGAARVLLRLGDGVALDAVALPLVGLVAVVTARDHLHACWRP